MPNLSRMSAAFLAVVVLCIVGAVSVLCTPDCAVAVERVAIFDFHNAADLKARETRYLVDIVRDVMREVLPSAEFVVLTGENVSELLPPGRDMAQCVGDCVVETGRLLAVDWVVAGEILTIENQYRVTLSLFSTRTGNLASSERVGGPQLLSMEEDLEMASRHLLEVVLVRNNTAGAQGRDASAGTWRPESSRAAVVEFLSTPPGAAVLVDSMMMCPSTPCSRELAVGTYWVTMQRDRYLERSGVLRIQTGEKKASVSWVLEPDFGWLDMKSKPVGALVLVDGVPQGRTPLAGMELPPGRHNILVEHDSYRTSSHEIMIARGQRIALESVLEARFGAVDVSAVDIAGNAVNGRVFIDGELVGETPCILQTLSGVHNIEVRHNTGGWASSLEVREGETVRSVARLDSSAWRAEAAAEYQLAVEGHAKTQRMLKGIGMLSLLTSGIFYLYASDPESSLTAQDRESYQKAGGVLLGVTIVDLAILGLNGLLGAPSEEGIYKDLVEGHKPRVVGFSAGQKQFSIAMRIGL